MMGRMVLVNLMAQEFLCYHQVDHLYEKMYCIHAAGLAGVSYMKVSSKRIRYFC